MEENKVTKEENNTTESKITKESINALFETLKNNAAVVNDWNDRLMDSCEEESWGDTVAERSKILRQVYQENEKICSEFWDSLPPRLYGEEIDLLFDLMHQLHSNMLFIVSFGLRLGRLLLPYYEDRQDYGRIVFLNYALGYGNYLLFDRTLNVDGPSDWLSYFEKVTEYETHYAEINEESFRGIFYTAYLNLLQYSGNYPSLAGRTHEFYQRAHDLWASEAVQAIDSGTASIQSKMAEIEDQYLYLLTIDPSLVADVEEYCTLAEQALKKSGRVNVKSDPTGFYKIMENNTKRLRKQSTDEASLQAISDYILKAIPPLNFEKGDSKRTYQLLMNEHISYAYGVKLLQGLPAEKQSLLDKAMMRVIEDSLHTPYAFYHAELNWVFFSFYGLTKPYIKDEETKRRILMNLILCRQPITCFQSKMVSRIACSIAESALARKPELFVGLPGYDNVDAVKNGRKELLSQIEKCGILHDIGKCRVAVVINTQDRRLTEDEFGILKYHPQLGAKLLSNDEAFAPYHDVILGHHKTYDGQGYPNYFDNTASPMRILIDLISIADSTDAATDHLGRNYSEGKDFSKLLEELKEGSGTRYNPDLVSIICEDKKLQKELEELTSKGRLGLYQQTCKEILNMHKNA